MNTDNRNNPGSNTQGSTGQGNTSQGSTTARPQDRSSGTASTVASAGTSAHGAVDKAAGAAEQVVAKARESAHSAVEKAIGATTPAAKWLEQREIYAKEKEEQLVEATSEYVLAHPVKALGIAFVVGLLVGKIIL